MSDRPLLDQYVRRILESRVYDVAVLIFGTLHLERFGRGATHFWFHDSLSVGSVLSMLIIAKCTPAGHKHSTN